MYQVVYIKRTVLLLLLALLVISTDNVYHSLHLNLAHIALACWAFTPEQAEQERCLSAAIQWGEQAGAAWMERRGHGERAQTLWMRMGNEDILSRRRAEAAYQEGRDLEHQGHLRVALAAYQQAIRDDERYVKAGYAVYQLATQTGQLGLAQSQAQALHELEPKYPVTTTLSNRVRLLGYDLDEVYLERDTGPIPITFYWKLPVPVKDVVQWRANGWMYVAVQNRLYQIGVVDNLLPNGGFERDLSTMPALPYGYQDIAAPARFRSYPDALRIRHRLTVDTRDGNITQVAVVMNPVHVMNPVEELSGMTTLRRVAVKPSTLYVLGGWMRVGDSGIGYLGGVWRTDDGENVRYWYVAERRPAQPWQHAVSATTAPKEATVFVPLALNDDRGQVCFDNLIFFELPMAVQTYQ